LEVRRAWLRREHGLAYLGEWLKVRLRCRPIGKRRDAMAECLRALGLEMTCKSMSDCVVG